MPESTAGSRGEQAERPRDIPLRGWKQVLLRVKDEIGKDNLSIVAAGVAFYALFAIFPAISTFVTLYGLVTDPAEVERQLATLRDLMPEAAFGIVQQQMHSVVSQASGSLSLGLLLSLALATWSATKGTNAIFMALNIAYGEHEERGFLSLNLWSLAFTVGGFAFVVVALFVIAAVPAALAIVGSPEGVLGFVLLALRWVLMAVLLMLALALVYRYGPSRVTARLQWVSPGGRRDRPVARRVRGLLPLCPAFRQLRQHLRFLGRGRDSADVVLHLRLCRVPRRGVERGAGKADPTRFDHWSGEADRHPRCLRRRQQSHMIHIEEAA